MKVQKIEYLPNRINFKNKKQKVNAESNEQTKNKKLLVGSLAVLSSAALVGFYIKTNGANASKTVVNQTTNEVKKHISELVQGLELYTGKKINPENLSSIMNKEEFVEAISKLKRENYILSKDNMEKGIFRADLHSHSVFSDGKGSVEDILNQVAEYSDKLYKISGEKFIFALTDHDNAEGVKLALKIISDSPEKFKNTRFVTGAEISYLLKSNKTSNQCETSELLVYGFNPFSKEVENFFANLRTKRVDMRKDFIKDISEKYPEIKFSEEEFLDVFLNKRENHTPMMNSIWQVYHYLQIKNILARTALAKGLNSEEYFIQTMEKAPDKLNVYELKKANLIENWINEDSNIKEIIKKYLSFINEDGKIVNKGESRIDDIAAAFENQEDCVMGFAHPYYITERTSEIKEVINEIKTKMADKLKVTESYHQGYSEKLIKEHSKDIDDINSLCESQDLIAIGGLDNHKSKWLNS